MTFYFSAVPLWKEPPCADTVSAEEVIVMATVQQPQVRTDRGRSHRQLTAATWGALFVWVGLAVLFNVGWGYGSLAFGLIILAGEVLHSMIGSYRLDWFATIVGLMFAIGGIWALFNFRLALVPVLCIAAGVVLMISALTARPSR